MQKSFLRIWHYGWETRLVTCPCETTARQPGGAREFTHLNEPYGKNRPMGKPESIRVLDGAIAPCILADHSASILDDIYQTRREGT